MPGASRNGMTLAAARLRGFDREDANALSRHVALPVIVGASLLKGVRLARAAFRRGMGAALRGRHRRRRWLDARLGAGSIRQVERVRLAAGRTPPTAWRWRAVTPAAPRLPTCEHRAR